MKKIQLTDLMELPKLSKNKFIMSLYIDDEDIRLCCTDFYEGILLEEDLESVLEESGIDMIISNNELAILVQGDLFYTVKYEHKENRKDGLIDSYLNFNTLKLITYKNNDFQKNEELINYIKTKKFISFNCDDLFKEDDKGYELILVNLELLNNDDKEQMIKSCDFDIIKLNDCWKLEDLQGANLGSIEDDSFDVGDYDSIIERLEAYWNDYGYYFMDEVTGYKIIVNGQEIQM